MNYKIRQQKLAARLRESGNDALLVTHLPNIYYLCGFTGTAGALLFVAREHTPRLIFFTDGRYTQQAADEVHGAKVVIAKKTGVLETRLQKMKLEKLGFESEHLPYAMYHKLARSMRGTRLKPLAGLVEELRAIKDVHEIEQIRKAALLAASIFPKALSSIKPGVTENVIAGELELHARGAGAEKMSFDTIVAAGPRSALPHGRASSQPIPQDGFIILDYGVILAGYC